MSLIKKLLKKDWHIILLFIFFFIFIRSVYFSQLFRFIYDQVTSSIVALDLWKHKEITLIGPPMSLNIGNRQIFFGGVSYYIQLFFLLIGRFDPFWATYSFMIFASTMIIPLYIGTKKLINKNAAIVMCVIYTFMPFYIEGTVYLWNPYFQLALSPVLIYLLSLFKQKQTLIVALLIGFTAGILFQLHYQFLVVLIGLAVYFMRFQKINVQKLLAILLGFTVGVGNLILFEVRNNFYLTNTLLLFFKSSGTVASTPLSDYYGMSILFFGLLIVLFYTKKLLQPKIITTFTIVMVVMAIQYTYISAADRNFPPGWYHSNEKQVYSIIADNYKKGITNFNVFAFYDATAYMQKYFLKRDDISINYDDYYNNRYLYVVYEDSTYLQNPAYEINTFTPSIKINEWKINDRYNLYLLERLYRE